MKCARKFLGILLILVALVPTAPPAFADAPASVADKGWVLYGTSGFIGDFVIYTTAHAIKVIGRKMGATAVTRAPKWLVDIFNDKSRLKYQCTLNDFKVMANKHAGNTPELLAAIKGTPKQEKGGAMIAGLHTKVLFMDDSSTGAGRQCRIWITKDLQAPPQLGEMLQNFFGIPKITTGVPLRVVYIDKSGNNVLAFDVTKSQPTQLSGGTFYVPQNYKATHDIIQVVVDQDNQKLLDDLYNDLAGGPSGPSGTRPSYSPSGGKPNYSPGPARGAIGAAVPAKRDLRAIGKKMDQKDVNKLFDLLKDFQK